MEDVKQKQKDEGSSSSSGFCPEEKNKPSWYTPLEEIEPIVAGLKRSFRSGKTMPIKWREEQLRQLILMLKENSSEVTKALTKDLQQNVLIAASEVTGPIKEAEMALANLATWLKPEPKPVPMLNKPGHGLIIKEPLGTVLIISPWNYPFSLLLKPLVGAIAGGNCVCLKPSEVSSSSAQVIARLVPKYLDNDCIRVVEGAVEETTILLKQQWDYIFYTGNGNVGRVVMRAAAEHLTPVTLELGGKSPAIVDEHVDLDVAARRLCWAKYTCNAGQTCVAPDYILVTRDMEKPLLEKLKQTIIEFYGEDPRNSRDYSRIVNRHHAARVASLLEGQNVYYGGDVDVNNRYISPTILTNVDPSSKVMQEEIFGPVLPVLAVDSVEEAIQFVNERDKPLALYVFSNSKQTQQEVLNRTSSGGAAINDAVLHVVCPELPFGGVGPSGMGSYNGKATFETFVHRKSVLARGTWGDSKIRYPPYTPKKIQWLMFLNGGVKFNFSWLVSYAVVVAPVVAALIYYKYGYARSGSGARL
jgi:aldehyde dehydrogenase (NAD+)